MPFPIVGEGWRGVLMPLRPMGDRDYDPLDGLALEVAS